MPRNRHKKLRSPIVWGIPCDEVMYSKFFIKFLKSAGFIDGDKFAMSEGTYLPKARNMVHNAAYDAKMSLMMIDSDVLFPPLIAEKLIAHNLPIVGGWYRDKNGKNPCVYDFQHEKDGVPYYKHRDVPGVGLEQVDAMGAGCWFMSADVVQKLGKNPYHMNTGGEDMVICRKMQELGIPLYVDWSLNCAHLGVFYV